MGELASGALLEELFEEYSEWYLCLAGDDGVLPRSISGVSGDGRQFIYMIDDLELHHMARNKYLRFVLDQNAAMAYAYAGLALRGDSDQAEIDEVLDVVVADAERYIIGHWKVIRREDGAIAGLKNLGTRQGDDLQKQPASWFLSGSIRFNEAEMARFGSIWEADRPGVTFNDRSAWS
ncbi:MAG: hypothetical protein HGB04_08880 [Chlorobiaceae bacterium]|nr:hypothetical protein [Chlorobiaceae bacterium]